MTQHTAPLPTGMSLGAFQHGFSTHWMDIDRDPSEWFMDVLGRALQAGYRRFDCNPVWDTEPIVGAAIARSSTPRQELIVTTVVPYNQLGARRARESVGASLDRLNLDHLDAVLVSAPITGWDIEGTATAMNTLVDEGLVTRVGARYMSPTDLETFRTRLSTPLFAHLTELHPLWPADELRRHAVEHGYWLIADSPLMQGMVREVAEVRRAAARTGASPFQVTLAWLHRHANVATSTWSHVPAQMRENLAADHLVLDQTAADDISGITRRWSAAPHLHPVPGH